MRIKNDGKAQLKRQLGSLYGITPEEEYAIDTVYDETLERLDHSFSRISNKYYRQDGETIFDPLHNAQWTMFLYEISRVLFLRSKEERTLCDKLYSLSKAVSAVDLFYEVRLPSIWFCDHPQASVLGRAEYGDYLSFAQGCTVGNNKGRHPALGEHVILYSGAKILGNCHAGDHVIFAANAFVMDLDIPSYSLVYGQHPDNTIVPISKEKFMQLESAVFIQEPG